MIVRRAVHGEWGMAHTQARMAAIFDISRRSPETENEELAKPLLGSRQIVLRIELA